MCFVFCVHSVFTQYLYVDTCDEALNSVIHTQKDKRSSARVRREEDDTNMIFLELITAGVDMTRVLNYVQIREHW